MFQSMMINGKEYIPSAEIAVLFGYTADYVSRLAREGKVVAANINRKWFVEKGSLAEFSRLAENQKDERSVQLKKQRKIERLMHNQKLKEVKKKGQYHVHVAMSQTLAVVMCGIFAGLLGWTVSGTDLSSRDYAYGAQSIYQQLAQVFVPETVLSGSFSSWLVATVIQK